MTKRAHLKEVIKTPMAALNHLHEDVREKISQSLKPTWIDLDRHGYMKSLRRNGMFFIVSELLQNSWDSDATEVAVSLSQPSNGESKLTCVDNSPEGYTDLSHAHTLFAESEKKHDTTRRGRFNAGEKQVLCMMKEAEISSTTGTLTFLKNGKRRESSVGTEVGSSFSGVLALEPSEYDDIVKRVQMVIPPKKIVID